MSRKEITWAWITLLVLTIGALIGFWYVAFYTWMTAARPEYLSVWHHRFYVSLTIFIVFGFCWCSGGLVIQK